METLGSLPLQMGRAGNTPALEAVLYRNPLKFKLVQIMEIACIDNAKGQTFDHNGWLGP